MNDPSLIGGFSNDFIGGMALAFAIALVTWMGTFVWMLYRKDPAEGQGPDDYAPEAPDPVPGIMANLDDEWRRVNR